MFFNILCNNNMTEKNEFEELGQKCVNQVQIRILKCGTIDEACPRINISTIQQVVQGTQYIDVEVSVSGTNPQECCRQYRIACGIYNMDGQQIKPTQYKGPFSVGGGQSYSKTVVFRFTISDLNPGTFIIKAWIEDVGRC